MNSPETRASAVLTIDVGAVAANWRLLAARLKPACQCAAVVKADGYGLGASSVAPALEAAGCRQFFVATLDEAITLRPHVPNSTLFVLNGPYPGTEEDFVDAGVLPVLNAPEQIERWQSLERRQGKPLAAALHVDTGMSRLGLTIPDAERLAAHGSLKPVLLMSHLACADQPEDPLNRMQAERFDRVRALFPGIPGSLAASSGIFLGPAWHHDGVRTGAALWGINPTPKLPNPMAQVVRLKGKIIQLRDVDAGDTVGYGAAYRAAKPCRLAVVAAGYADGLFRSLVGRGIGHVGGRPVPLVGRVSMDLIIFDVSDIPAAEVVPGAFIDLIGENNDVDQVAAAAGTSAYELLTALGPRYRRQYVGEASL